MRLILVLASFPLLAHDTYLMPQKFRTNPGETIVVSVHNGDSFPQSEDAVDPRRLTVRLPGGGLLENLSSMNKATHGVWKVEQTGALYVTAETQPRMLEMAPAKFEAYLLEEGLGHVVEWRKSHGESEKPGREMYSKAAKTLVVSGAANGNWSVPQGLPLEFVPVTDPTKLTRGGEVVVRVLFQGQPLAGVQVEKAWAGAEGNGHAIAGRTAADGTLRVTLDAAGRWRLHAVTMRRHDDAAQADWRSHWASLTFQVDGAMTSSVR